MKEKIDIVDLLVRKRNEREVGRGNEDGVGHDLLGGNEVVHAKDVEADHVREGGEGKNNVNM